MNRIAPGFAFGLLALIAAGCAELKNDLPPAGGSLTVHESGWADPASGNFHGKAIRSAGWNMAQCQTCHGSGYDGGTSDVSCRTCHSSPAGPENCATCHGSASSPAPPGDLDGNTETTARGVGAHQRHLSGGSLSNAVVCSECHRVYPKVYTAGHLDDSPPADVVFNGRLGPLPSSGGTYVPAPSYSPSTMRCDNSYCHGAWRASRSSAPPSNRFAYADTVMAGGNFAPLWTGGGSEAACGSCHGLPPVGHIAATLTVCGSCHTGIVNSSGQIADKSKHINGRLNVFGQERDF